MKRVYALPVLIRVERVWKDGKTDNAFPHHFWTIHNDRDTTTAYLHGRKRSNRARLFTSTLNRATEEILFEVYDCRSDGRNQFMGLAIVGVEELLVNPYQRQVLSLQARPYQDDPVSGTLTLEVSAPRVESKNPPESKNDFSITFI